jgi:hypothetical protein
MSSCLGNYGIAEAVRTEVWRVRMESSSDSYVWNESLIEISPESVATRLTSDGRFPVGAKVCLTVDFASYSDAAGGPLHLGDVGVIVTDDRGSKPYKVEFNGRTWWYEAKALQLSVPAPAQPTTQEVPVCTVEKSKSLGDVSRFDIGFGIMDRPVATFSIGNCDVAESIGIIGAICRISHLSLKNQGTSGVQRLLSHDVLGPLLRLAFLANSTSIRIAATKAVCLLLPYSSPAVVSSSIKCVFPTSVSFAEFCLERIGAQLDPYSSVFSSINREPLAFTETYQLLDMLTMIFLGAQSNTEWNDELRKGNGKKILF